MQETTTELIGIWCKIENLLNNKEDVLAFVLEDVVYMCNIHAGSHTVDGKPGDIKSFVMAQNRITAELESRGVTIQIDGQYQDPDSMPIPAGVWEE